MQMLRLPQPQFRPIYYAVVFIDLCKASEVVNHQVAWSPHVIMVFFVPLFPCCSCPSVTVLFPLMFSFLLSALLSSPPCLPHPVPSSPLRLCLVPSLPCWPLLSECSSTELHCWTPRRSLAWWSGWRTTCEPSLSLSLPHSLSPLTLSPSLSPSLSLAPH